MTRSITVGIDVGSATTRIVVGEFQKGEKNPRIIGIGESETRGMRHGYVTDPQALVVSINKAKELAEKSSGIKIKRAFVSLGGVSLRSEVASGMVIVSKADGKVTNLDIDKSMEECEENLNLSNKKIIHTFPVSFRLDGKEILGRLEGAHGTKLETKTLCITYSIQHLEDLIGALAEAGIETIEVIASPVSSANIVLSEKQKIAGVALVNIGSETTTIAVFENGGLVSVYTFSIGSGDVTNDIALGLKITLEDAENIKQGNVPENLSKKKLDEIIEARLSDIFELIENHLKKIKRSGLLPAGIVFVGGGANIRRLEELSKSILKLPSSLGTTEFFGNSKTKLRDGAWFTALGLILNKKDEVSYSSGSLNHLFKDLKETLKSSIKQLMP